jgi:Sec-independent protein translocase protein TatA
MNLFSIGPLEIVLIFIVGVLVVGPQRMVQYSQRISKWVKNARKFIQQYSIVLKDIQDLNIEEDTERKDEKSKEKNEEQNPK